MKIVVAYSGGLDTSVIVTWLKEQYAAQVIAAVVDVGQGDDMQAVKSKALASGASKVYIINSQKKFVEEYLWKALKAHAVYEGKYLLATSLARPLIAKEIVRIAKKEHADAVAHGATGKGNDQVRFELTFKALMPELKIIAPWREWDLASRADEIAYAKEHGIPVPVTKEKPYSSDANLWHVSYEGGILEDPSKPPDESMFTLTKSLEQARSKPQIIEIGFSHGIPVSLNRKKMNSVLLIKRLNAIAGTHGIGRVDIVENRLVGIKSRGVYESPAATVLYAAHRELESLVLDRDTAYRKQLLSLRYSTLIYNGLWFTEEREALDAFFNVTQKNVTGTVKLKLYKGNVVVMGRQSPYSLYDMDLATFEEDSLYNQQDAEGFINLYGLPIKVRALKQKQ
ncbi:MAG: argininosuccinate synthase [Elusimicrobia bacterium]|nr:argininosuccinate synthase [Elusimicrobiota bacterium]MBD3411749.1 argininosuccinate synthase [Elusimicrobiota bacterium]